MGFVTPPDQADVRVASKQQRQRDRILFALAFTASLILGAWAFVTASALLVLASAVLLVVCSIAMVRPVAGVHLLIFLTLLGDQTTAAWWPFNKNLSSRESIMFVSDSLAVTPLEIVIAALYVACLAPALARRDWRFARGSLHRPMLVISAFVLFGLLNGYSGGTIDVALFEARPLVYLVAVYFLIVNVFTERIHYHQALWVAMLATTGHALLSLGFYRGLDPAEKEGLESLGEHSATVQMNAMFLFGVGLVLLNGSRLQRRVVLLLAVPVVYVYLVAQRRAAMVALFAGIIIMLVVLFRHRRTAFWVLAPTLTILGLGAIAATWNAEGLLGLPASAVKSVLMPDQLSAADRESSAYRDLEAINLWYTIRASPILGFGFGQPFIVVVPMPNISFFVFWQYLPHNSILWLWIKMGFFGFVAVLYTFARTVFTGARAVARAVAPHDIVLLFVSVGYVVMFVIFAYVDIAFSTRPAVFLALCMAACTDFEQARPPAERLRPGEFRRLRSLVLTS